MADLRYQFPGVDLSRFKLNRINLGDKADISKVMDNFDKIDAAGITYDETTNLINALDESLGQLAKRKYSYGKDIPSGGNDGDIYDQYFD